MNDYLLFFYLYYCLRRYECDFAFFRYLLQQEPQNLLWPTVITKKNLFLYRSFSKLFHFKLRFNSPENSTQKSSISNNFRSSQKFLISSNSSRNLTPNSSVYEHTHTYNCELSTPYLQVSRPKTRSFFKIHARLVYLSLSFFFLSLTALVCSCYSGRNTISLILPFCF